MEDLEIPPDPTNPGPYDLEVLNDDCMLSVF